jgi:hypothetical protein
MRLYLGKIRVKGIARMLIGIGSRAIRELKNDR